MAPAAIVTDIEGTTSSIAFVHEVLFPYAARRLPGFIAEHGAEAPVRVHLDNVRRTAGLAGGGDAAVVATLQAWIAADRKDADLKALQGLVWDEGWDAGAFHAHVYDDVPPLLARWRARGLTLAVFSSGSMHAQRRFFAHTGHGDLSAHFSGHFDTTVGAKREASAYRRIAAALAQAPADILYLSDVPAELDAAAEAGLRTCLICREQLIEGTAHRVERDFHGVERLVAA